jgi:hypothetical protein
MLAWITNVEFYLNMQGNFAHGRYGTSDITPWLSYNTVPRISRILVLEVMWNEPYVKMMGVKISKFHDFREISIYLGYVIERRHTLTICQAIRTIFHEPG